MRSLLASLLVFALLTGGLLRDGFALAALRSPAGALFQAPQPLSRRPSAVVKHKARNDRDPSSYYSELQEAVFAKLRPVERSEPIDFDDATRLLNTRISAREKIFNKDFEGKMRNEYAGRVSPMEKAVNDPLWRPSYWEVQAYEGGRESLARWTTREVLEDQLKDFFNGGDQSSGAMKAMHTARALTGGDDEKPKDNALTPAQKIARAHRTDLPQKEEEEKIPTKVKAKMNVLRQNGSVTFSNPIVMTSLNGDRHEISLNMNKSFRKLTLSSNVGYAVNQECLNVNVNKKITDHVSLDLDHFNYTGGKRGASGEKTREQARVNYSIGF